MTDALRYDRDAYDIGRLDPHWADAQIARMIGKDKRVLELGCATGYVGRYLKEARGCRVTGIELDPRAAEKARPGYEKIVVGDIADEKTLREADGRYDAVLCSNVLEHLPDPGKVLARLKPFLDPGGFFVVALPNVAHWSVRLGLLRGRFDYAETGVLDRTHLRFFTLKTARELLEGAGLKVEEWGFDWDSGMRPVNALRFLPAVGPKLVEAVYSLSPEFFGYQFVFKARPV